MLIETLLIYPNIFADVPTSLVRSTAFFSAVGPGDVFPVLGLATMLIGVATIAMTQGKPQPVPGLQVPRPFLTLLVIGLVYGVLVGLTHQLLWPWAFDTAPRLGGSLAGTLSPVVESMVLRLFAFGSSMLTGPGVGALVGLVGWAALRVRGPRTHSGG